MNLICKGFPSVQEMNKSDNRSITLDLQPGVAMLFEAFKQSEKWYGLVAVAQYLVAEQILGSILCLYLWSNSKCHISVY